jgi:hypothetical protein
MTAFYTGSLAKMRQKELVRFLGSLQHNGRMLFLVDGNWILEKAMQTRKKSENKKQRETQVWLHHHHHHHHHRVLCAVKGIDPTLCRLPVTGQLSTNSQCRLPDN